MHRAYAAASFMFLAVLTASVVGKNEARRPPPEGHIPHLKFDAHDSVFLRHNESWRPGQSTLITALASGKPLQVHLDLHHIELQPRPPTCTLLYKCNVKDKDYEAFSLHQNIANQSVSLCKHTRPFTIVGVPVRNSKPSYKYNLTLSQQNSIPFSEAMIHLLEFRVRVAFAEGVTESGSLFVYNLDPLAKLNNKPVLSAQSNIIFTKYILTDEATTFLTNLTVDSPAIKHKSVREVQLLNKLFLVALKQAAILIRTVLYVSVIVRGNKNCTDTLEPDSNDIMFTSGDSHPAFRNSLPKKLNSFIHLEKGILIYSETVLATQRSKLSVSFIGKPIRVCLRISLNAPVWDYNLMLDVAVLNPDYFARLPGNAYAEICKSIGDKADGGSWKLLSAGMTDVLLLSPIVCTEIAKVVVTVLYNGIECENVILGTNREWQDCPGYKISNHGNAIWLNTVEQRHAGSYKFLAQGKIFTYYLTVVSLPLFNTPTMHGSLPHTTYANLDLRVSLNCTVFHDGMKYVTLKPVFRVRRRFGADVWQDYDIEEFPLKVLKKTPDSITAVGPMISSPGDKSTNLFVVMPHVITEWRTWILIYSCRAEIESKEANKMGLPHYLVESSTDVVYFGKRITSSKQASRVSTSLLVVLYVLLQAPVIVSGSLSPTFL